MSFVSPAFLWYFMPVALAGLWLLPKRARNVWVALASVVFYAWGAGEFVLVLLGAVAVNFCVGLLFDSERVGGVPARRKALLVGAVVFNVSILVAWKYLPFASRQVQEALRALGPNVDWAVRIALPIGISFFTFHHISYVVDVYRRVRPPQRNVMRFMVYILMFPQLIAGPIVRYHQIDDQLPVDHPRDRMDDFAAGFPRFALGLFKKVVIADAIAPLVDAVYGLPAGQVNTSAAWIGALAYTLQIYFDFSGYTDMALGLGKMLGFRLPENFDRPYSAVSMTDFWRRWHMSLTRWFRDYVYIPIGGNRGTTARTCRNLMFVFVLTGIWHGAGWTFVVWGLYHGLLLVGERLTGLRDMRDPRWEPLRRAVVMLLVIIGWVPFRSESLAQAKTILAAMFVPDLGPLPAAVESQLTNATTLIFVLAGLVVLIPRSFVLGRYLDAARTRLATGTRFAFSALAAPYAAVLVAAGTFSPFLYFRF